MEGLLFLGAERCLRIDEGENLAATGRGSQPSRGVMLDGFFGHRLGATAFVPDARNEH